MQKHCIISSHANNQDSVIWKPLIAGNIEVNRFTKLRKKNRHINLQRWIINVPITGQIH